MLSIGTVLSPQNCVGVIMECGHFWSNTQKLFCICFFAIEKLCASQPKAPNINLESISAAGANSVRKTIKTGIVPIWIGIIEIMGCKACKKGQI